MIRLLEPKFISDPTFFIDQINQILQTLEKYAPDNFFENSNFGPLKENVQQFLEKAQEIIKSKTNPKTSMKKHLNKKD
jgi:hypothetical protein